MPAENTTSDVSVSVERYRTALTKINGIRNSIIGVQGFNWSEHAYPLVAALDEAGFEGQCYDDARANVGTLIERANAAETENERLRAALSEMVYETTHLSPMRVDGSHDCRISADALANARAALTGDAR